MESRSGEASKASGIRHRPFLHDQVRPPLPPCPFLHSICTTLILVSFRALHLADLITELNGKSSFLPPSKLSMLLLLLYMRLAQYYCSYPSIGFCGFMSILSSMRYCLGPSDSFGHMWAALAFMPFGLFFDFMDGKVARWRGKSSLMGQELDSLADLVRDWNLFIANPDYLHPATFGKPRIIYTSPPYIALRLTPRLDFLRCGTCSVRLCSWPPNPT